MTTLADRPNAALLVIDVQNGVIRDCCRRDAVVANIGTLVEQARREPLVDKTYGDSFEATAPQRVPSDLRVGRLVVTGAQTEAWVRGPLHGAKVRGCDTTLASDAHTSGDHSAHGAPPAQVIAHTNLYWSHESAPVRIADTSETSRVDVGPAA